MSVVLVQWLFYFLLISFSFPNPPPPSPLAAINGSQYLLCFYLKFFI